MRRLLESPTTLLLCSLVCCWTASNAFTLPLSPGRPRTLLFSSASSMVQLGQATELPDSLEDAAIRAAEASAAFCDQGGTRCRVDFDTSIGDETFTLLKTSTEFMQNYVRALCYAIIPGLLEERQKEMMAVAEARAELKALEGVEKIDEEREDVLVQLIARDGRSDSVPWQGPKARVYFPDEGSAALARRDWTGKVPACVEFSSCGGVQLKDVSNDRLVFFFCPKASESESVEQILQRTEERAADPFTIFVNPNLVDMGVTGFGLAGRM